MLQFEGCECFLQYCIQKKRCRQSLTNSDFYFPFLNFPSVSLVQPYLNPLKGPRKQHLQHSQALSVNGSAWPFSSSVNSRVSSLLIAYLSALSGYCSDVAVFCAGVSGLLLFLCCVSASFTVSASITSNCVYLSLYSNPIKMFVMYPPCLANLSSRAVQP